MPPAVSLLATDRDHVWHPYAPAGAAPEWVVRGARGSVLTLEDASGRVTECVDAMASWWCAVHGYRHPVLDAAAHAQVDRFSHVMFGGLTHEPAVELCRALVDLTPAPLTRVFLADSGSVSVEVALKAAVQAAQGRGRPAFRFLALRGAYHGDTTGAMSVCDPEGGLHELFAGVLPQQVFAQRPPQAGCDGGVVDPRADAPGVEQWCAQVEALARAHAAELAGIVVEPVLQGVGGMRAYPARCLRFLRDLADDLGILLIADEIATGLGRTGALLACEHAGVVPDILCLGKALTGGYLTGAAMLCTEAVAQAVEASDAGVLMHGPTFMGSPLASAVARASVGLIATGRWRGQVADIERGLAQGLAPAREIPGVADVRAFGAVGVIECEGPVDAAAVTRAAVARGVWVRPFRSLVYTMPPYVITADELDRLTQGLVAAVAEAGR